MTAILIGFSVGVLLILAGITWLVISNLCQKCGARMEKTYECDAGTVYTCGRCGNKRSYLNMQSDEWQ